jgi:hypothetical protein
VGITGEILSTEAMKEDVADHGGGRRKIRLTSDGGGLISRLNARRSPKNRMREK